MWQMGDAILPLTPGSHCCHPVSFDFVLFPFLSLVIYIPRPSQFIRVPTYLGGMQSSTVGKA